MYGSTAPRSRDDQSVPPKWAREPADSARTGGVSQAVTSLGTALSEASGGRRHRASLPSPVLSPVEMSANDSPHLRSVAASLSCRIARLPAVRSRHPWPLRLDQERSSRLVPKRSLICRSFNTRWPANLPTATALSPSTHDQNRALKTRNLRPNWPKSSSNPRRTQARLEQLPRLTAPSWNC